MELELGLALPNQQTPMMQQGIKARLDLNYTYNINGTDLQMENSNKDASCYNNNNQKNRYYFEDHITGDDEEEVESSNKGLSLLLWSGQQPNEDKWRNPHFNQQDMNVEEEDEEILGWPLINSLRKELILQRHHHHHHLHNMVQGHNDDHRRRRRRRMRVGSVGVELRNYKSKSKYVKVKMEGVPIGRKIDLTLYNSYHDLTHTLIYRMFAKYCAGNDSKHGDYTILYQDKQGDWMLAADIPWETFVESVQRMKILRNVK